MSEFGLASERMGGRSVSTYPWSAASRDWEGVRSSAANVRVGVVGMFGDSEVVHGSRTVDGSYGYKGTLSNVLRARISGQMRDNKEGRCDEAQLASTMENEDSGRSASRATAIASMQWSEI